MICGQAPFWPFPSFLGTSLTSRAVLQSYLSCLTHFQSLSDRADLERQIGLEPYMAVRYKQLELYMVELYMAARNARETAPSEQEARAQQDCHGYCILPFYRFTSMETFICLSCSSRSSRCSTATALTTSSRSRRSCSSWTRCSPSCQSPRTSPGGGVQRLKATTDKSLYDIHLTWF